MSNGYLGKISAIVSANTADFDSKLNRSSGEVKKFAASMQGALTNAQSSAASSLRGIYTDAQKLERTLQAAVTRKMRFAGLDSTSQASLDAAAEKTRKIASATAGIFRPLSNGVKEFGRLPAEMQAEFLPALKVTQRAAEALSDTIERFGTVGEQRFNNVAKRVEATTAAMSRLKQAATAVSGLSTGQELQFRAPAVSQALSSAASAQNAALKLSPQEMAAKGIGGLVAQQYRAAADVARAQAAVESAEISANAKTESPKARAALWDKLAVLKQITAELNKQSGMDDETALLIRKQQLAKELESQKQAPAKAVDDMLSGKARRGYDAQSEILGGVVSRLSGDAFEQGRAALLRFEEAKQRALKAPGDTGLRKELEKVGNEAVRSIAKLEGSGTNTKNLQRLFSRAGDVGRQGVDKWSLALNQAAFAVDDFLSSTGGIEFKLRAVSNNITQLAFILGNTTGLFIGLGAVIGGQVAVQIYKWINNGKTAEDQTKSLNDALSKQKSLVDDVASSFRSLSKELSNGVTSQAATQAMSIEELARQQKKSREGEVGNKNRAVVETSSKVAQLERELAAESTPGRRAAIEERLRAARAEESTRRRAAQSRGPDSVNARIEQDAADIEAAKTKDRDRLRFVLGTGISNAVVAAGDFFRPPSDTSRVRRAAMGQGGDTPEAIASRMEALRAESREIEKSAKRRYPGGIESNESADAEKKLAKNAEDIAKLESELKEAIDRTVLEFVKSFGAASGAVSQAQSEAADAIKSGIPGALEFAAEADAIGKLLKDAEREFGEAQDEADKVWRDRRERGARSIVEEAAARAESLVPQSDALRYDRIVDPQRQIDARVGRVRQNLGDARMSDSAVARQLREIESQRETLRLQRGEFEKRGINDPMTQRMFAQSEAALNKQVIALEAASLAVKEFGVAVSRASEEAKRNLTAAEQAADDARRKDIELGTDLTGRERRIAEDDLKKQRQIEAQAQVDLQFEQDKQAEIRRGPEFDRMREIDAMLSRGNLNAEQKDVLREERLGLMEKVRPQFEESEKRTQEINERGNREDARRRQSARGRELGDEMLFADEKFRRETEENIAAIEAADSPFKMLQIDEYKRRRANEARTQTLSGRGEEASLTESEKFRKDIVAPGGLVESLTARRKELADAGAGEFAQRRFLQKTIEQQLENVAPMLAGFKDERETARLQGPSRAKIEVSDVTTAQGMSELNRMLRGDDPSKDVNLAELRKQTDKMDELIKAVRESNPGVIP